MFRTPTMPGMVAEIGSVWARSSACANLSILT